MEILKALMGLFSLGIAASFVIAVPTFLYLAIKNWKTDPISWRPKIYLVFGIVFGAVVFWGFYDYFTKGV